MHQFQYSLWEGCEEELLKMIATPAGEGNEFEADALSELSDQYLTLTSPDTMLVSLSPALSRSDPSLFRPVAIP